MTTWSTEELRLLAESDELDIAPLRQDRRRFAAPTTIWGVVVGGDLFVRAYGGPGARWYRSAIAQRHGRIHLDGRSIAVGFEPADPASAERIDAAYRAKYGRSSYLAPMLAPGARDAALRITPAGSDV